MQIVKRGAQQGRKRSGGLGFRQTGLQTNGLPNAVRNAQSKPGTLLSALPERFNADTCRRIAPSVDDRGGSPLSNRMD